MKLILSSSLFSKIEFIWVKNYKIEDKENGKKYLS